MIGNARQLAASSYEQHSKSPFSPRDLPAKTVRKTCQVDQTDRFLSLSFEVGCRTRSHEATDGTRTRLKLTKMSDFPKVSTLNDDHPRLRRPRARMTGYLDDCHWFNHPSRYDLQGMFPQKELSNHYIFADGKLLVRQRYCICQA
jgi:hypothetical protein